MHKGDADVPNQGENVATSVRCKRDSRGRAAHPPGRYRGTGTGTGGSAWGGGHTIQQSILLPKVAPKEKMKDYGSGKKALERLVAIAGGTTWEAEMDHLSAQKEADLEKVHGKASTESTGRLF